MANTIRRQTVLRVLLPALLLQFAFGLVYSWGAVAPYLLREHWSPLLVGAVFSATPAGYGTGIVVGGRLADRLPPRRLCWTGLGLFAAGVTTALLIPNPVTFIFLYSMLGLGFGGGLALAGAIAAGRHVLPARLGLVSGAITAAYALAAPVQVPVISRLAESAGWLMALRTMGGSMLILSAVALTAMPYIPRPAPHSEERAGAGALLRRPLIWTAILLEACSTQLGAYALVNMAAYTRGLHLAAWIATVAITAVVTGTAIGRIGGGAATDRLGADRLMLLAFMIDAACAIVLFFAPASPELLPLVGILIGLTFGIPAGAVARLAQAGAPDAPNHAFGLVFGGFTFGAFSGPLVGAAVGGATAWLVVGAPAIAGLIVVAYRLRLGSRGGGPGPAL